MLAAAIPLGEPPNPIWREVMAGRNFQYPFKWQWYEWLGAIGPIFILGYFAKLGERENLSVFTRICRRLALSTTIGIVVAVAMTEFSPNQTWVRLEPMRILHFTYVLFILFAGALLGKYFMKAKPLRWLLILAPIAAGMFYAQRQSSSPRATTSNGPAARQKINGCKHSNGAAPTRRKTPSSRSIPITWCDPAKISSVSAASPNAACWSTPTRTIRW